MVSDEYLLNNDRIVGLSHDCVCCHHRSDREEAWLD